MSYTKKIYDSVHGFIRFNALEGELIDSAPFQRLLYIRQMGTAYLLYPGATNSRFEHSLGVMAVATQIFERIWLRFHGESEGSEFRYWRQIIRLAALCHDLGHLPFSHVAEKEILGEGGHERWTYAAIKSLFLVPIWQQLQVQYPQRRVVADLIKIAIGETKLHEIDPSLTPFTSWERVMSEVITGDFFGADRIDYLLRDARCTGLSYGLFDYHQLIEMLCIVQLPGDVLALGIEENGIESCEALLLGRHFMHQRVYQHDTVKAYSFHLARFMREFYQKKDYLSSLENYLSVNDTHILVALTEAADNRDAGALLKRQHRYRAIERKQTDEKQLLALRKELNIPAHMMAWGVAPVQKKHMDFSFPVLRRNQTVVDAHECTDIQIPSGLATWIYVAPEHEEKVSQHLEQYV